MESLGESRAIEIDAEAAVREDDEIYIPIHGCASTSLPVADIWVYR